MLRAGLSVAELAGCAGVETKTVERCISLSCSPHINALDMAAS